MMIIRAFSDRDPAYEDSLLELVRTWNVGGVCFFKGTPTRQASLTNRFQKAAKTPLLIAIDAEWGLGMRLDSAFAFPRPMTLGAVRNDSLVYRVACAIAGDCRRMGIHINLAPVVDINNNPSNPVINSRSFGEDRLKVAEKGQMFMKGLQDNNILSTAKHFPGHGDTDTDSHLSLPVISHSRQRLDSVELFPYRRLIPEGLGGIMIAHLYVPALDTSGNTPTTLSGNVGNTLLREEMGFRGIIITDALDMKGVTLFHKPGEIEVKALLAGNDILLLPQDVATAVNALRQAVDSGIVSHELIDRECRKILTLKYRAGLSSLSPVDTSGLYPDLNPESSEALTREVYKAAATLVKNNDRILPVRFLDRRDIAVLSIGDTCATRFQEMIAKYAPSKDFNLPADFRPQEKDSVVKKLDPFNLLIIGIHGTSSLPAKQFGISNQALTLIDSLSRYRKVVLDIFGSPYSLGLLKEPSNLEAIAISYQDVPASGDASAQAIFGGIPFSGQLPVTGSPLFPVASGLSTEPTRLEYVLPEETGIDPAALKKIDSLVQSGIDSRAYPGCQILFAKDGKVFYEKAFGHPRYEDTVAVSLDDLYDIASLTKVAATTLAVMKLSEEGKLLLDEALGKYLPEVRGSNKEKLTIREILAHQAGLQTWIPFYEKTLVDGKPDPRIYRADSSGAFPVRVADSLYIRRDYPDSVFATIINSPLRPVRDYKYSDLGFYLLLKVVEKLTGEPFEEYVSRQFYRPLGLQTMTFHPLWYCPRSRIIPTETDTVFRNRTLRGDVHDPGAAMLGGVSGHAGLFSDAGDLAVILQMLLNDGSYGGKQYFLPSTVREFTRVQFPEKGNRRGLGFDKPLPASTPDGPACESASPGSFGHSGFTGTYIWADPSANLIYVFLSNRVYPDSKNNRITEMNIRTRIHQEMYDIVGDEK
jgi:beta-glucosidase-like glycosyl hydrolase/CubicO group peptidase (beta-lactamase class C family)